MADKKIMTPTAKVLNGSEAEADLGVDHLNVFYSYNSKASHHEDQLTRGFLILFKHVKLVQLIFINMLIETLKKNGSKNLPSLLVDQGARVDQVKTQIGHSNAKTLIGDAGSAVSILITDDVLDHEVEVSKTERHAVYDGLIMYSPENWVFIIENKPSRDNVWDGQLSVDLPDGFDLEKKAIVLRWRDILVAVSTIVQNGLVSGFEASLVEDFLHFVHDKFPQVNPFDLLALCKDNLWLLEQRCEAIMEEAQLGHVEYHRGWHNYILLTDVPGVRQVTLYPEKIEGRDWQLTLDLAPGDSMAQAREFYPQSSITSILDLKGLGWDIKPNFHFAFRAQNLIWTTTSCSLNDYLHFWREVARSGELRQLKREEWHSQFDILKQHGIMADTDMLNIEKRILRTGMQTLNVCPGVILRFHWPKQKSIELDDKKALVQEFTARLRECIATWHKWK